MNLEQRVEKLERENRRLKLTGAALALLVASGALIGAMWSQQSSGVVRARTFEVVDGEGEALATFGYRSNPGGQGHAALTIGKPFSGKPSMDLNASQLNFSGPTIEGTELTVHQMFRMLAGMGERSAATFGAFGVIARDRGAAMTLLDEQGKTRAQLGTINLTSASTEGETDYPAAVVLFSAEGNVIWMAPR